MEELEEAKKRIDELEQSMKAMRGMAINLLTVLKEYASMVQNIYQASMGKKAAEEAADNLKKKYDFGKGAEN